jgi:hypothetical protein
MTELSEFPVHISSILGAVVHSGPKRNRTTYGTQKYGHGVWGSYGGEKVSKKYNNRNNNNNNKYVLTSYYY